MGKKNKSSSSSAAKSSTPTRAYVAAAVVAALVAVAFAAFASPSWLAPVLSSAEAQRKATLERPPPVEKSRTKDRAKSKGSSDKGGAKGSDTAGKASKSESGSSDAAGAGLRDRSDNCAGWAASGECAKNPAYMADECALSCKGQQPTQQAATQESSAREDTWTVDWPVPELQPDLARAMAEKSCVWSDQ